MVRNVYLRNRPDRQGMGEKRAGNLNFGRFRLKQAVVLATVLALYGSQVVPHSIWWWQVVPRGYRVVPGCFKGVAWWSYGIKLRFLKVREKVFFALGAKRDWFCGFRPPLWWGIGPQVVRGWWENFFGWQFGMLQQRCGHLHNLSPKSLLGFYRCWRGPNRHSFTTSGCRPCSCRAYSNRQ